MKRWQLVWGLWLAVCLALPSGAYGQRNMPLPDSVWARIEAFVGRHFSDYRPTEPMGVKEVRVSRSLRKAEVVCNEALGAAPFDGTSLRVLQDELAATFWDKKWQVELTDEHYQPLIGLLPGYLRGMRAPDFRRGKVPELKSAPWVTRVSRPVRFTSGLEGRHVFLWASHGAYYDGLQWTFQRPSLFCTREDLFSSTFVWPYLAPMLERAGCVVATPRERDWQSREALADNSEARSGIYTESGSRGSLAWTDAPCVGFAAPAGPLADGQNPFVAGTVRSCATRRKADGPLSVARWSPPVPESGHYAVYVSYATLPQSVDDAHYTVVHDGVSTHFRVNQQMGGGTWVYLGTFHFSAGSPNDNYVMLTNESLRPGVVTADAVRLGGGRGNTDRGGGVSGLPRFAEAARYAAQWAGMPYDVYSTRGGTDDYADDINVRSYMQNFLGGRSEYCHVPVGRGVPFELSLAVHTDAGIKPGEVVGTLGICTTTGTDGRKVLASGVSRAASADWARMLQDNICRDLGAVLGGRWSRRELWDRNYSETRNPEVPSAIVEMLSHQNFTDMQYGHDPHFKFIMARAIYKSVLRYIYYHHGLDNCVVQPLPVRCFAVDWGAERNEVSLRWSATSDSLEPTAAPTGYVVYQKEGNHDFDNGTYVADTTLRLRLEPGVLYAFRVSAVNAGGESFPSETLCAYVSSQKNDRKILIVNAFDRVGGPASVNRPDSIGFDLRRDVGVPYGFTAGFSGYQYDFDPSSPGWGATDDALCGRVLAGNTFDYTVEHGEALAQLGNCSFVSCQRDALSADLSHHDVVDLIEGAQRRNTFGLYPYATFPPRLRRLLTDYCQSGGRLIVSGAHLLSDEAAQPDFLARVLKCRLAGIVPAEVKVKGWGIDSIPFYHYPGEEHYVPASLDVITPTDGAEPLLYTADGHTVGIGYRGHYGLFVSTLPIECVSHVAERGRLMGRIMNYLFEN